MSTVHKGMQIDSSELLFGIANVFNYLSDCYIIIGIYALNM